MKIYERYSLAERIFRGKGLWALLLPLRAFLAIFYYLAMVLRRRAPGNILRHSGGHAGETPRTGARVVSIGNIVVGGGGKTPCVLELSRLEKKYGGNPVVVTRGYGGRAERSGRPVILGLKGRAPAEAGAFMTEEDYMPDGDVRIAGEFAEAFGDEISIYRKRGIPVVIDRDRRRGIELAERALDPTIVLLDDAYQNNSVKKDLDVLLLDYTDPFAGGKVLPLGKLREPPSAARRAEAVIFTRADGRRIPEEAERFVREKRILFSEHKFEHIYGREGKITAPERFSGERLALYSAIGNPFSFEIMVKTNVTEPLCSIRFSDHHRYVSGDIEWMIDTAGKGAVFLTTEKDWFKTYHLFPAGIQVYALRMRMVIEGGDGLLNRGRG